MVELLVVMAIIGILIAASIAGVAYALRRSRNIRRQTSLSNMEKALESYYGESQKYPGVAGSSPTPATIIANELSNFFEGGWDGGPAKSVYCYYTDLTASPNNFVVCASQEINSSSKTYNWTCTGPGIGTNATYFPATRTPASSTTCPTPATAGTSTWDGSSWGGGGGGIAPN